ncbi:MAG: HEAT repeat domain-containing protein [Sphingobacteriia bacterium]|nr:HEAT repeat domain-containing protein [Sphingobacteriia bacterium]
MKKQSKLTSELILQLNKGEIEARNLEETLAIDFAEFLKYVVPNINIKNLEVFKASKLGITTKMKLAAQILYEQFQKDIIEQLLTHKSDTGRGIVAYIIALIPNLNIKETLELIEPLARDKHFGVREWAWLGVREKVSSNLIEAIEILKTWSKNSDENIRRFAS